MKIVLNAIIAKLKGTGGFNVAINFFNMTLTDQENEWFYFVSNEFDQEIKGLDLGLDSNHYFVFHSQPNIRYYFKDKKRLRAVEIKIKPDLIYSILAPSYFKFKSLEVMRCSNAWVVSGGVNKYALKVIPVKTKYRYLIKAIITRFLMRNVKYFITQTEIAKKCILRTVHTSPENVCVISNVLPIKMQWSNFKKIQHEGFNMVYASSGAIHKDNQLLPYVAFVLKSKYGMNNFRIHVTIPDSSTDIPCLISDLRKYSVEDCFMNHGRLDQEQLVNLYSQCDMGLFPSLLETFSGTLLEYMYFQLPIVASDFDFNREVAEEAAMYFKPHDADDFAYNIYMVFSDSKLREKLHSQAKKRLPLYMNNTDKYKETVDFLKKISLDSTISQ